MACCLYQCCIQIHFGTVWTVWAPKKVLVTFFPLIFHVKTEWTIVYEYQKAKIFSRDTNNLPQMHWTSNIFRQSTKTIIGFWVSVFRSHRDECNYFNFFHLAAIFILYHFLFFICKTKIQIFLPGFLMRAPYC